MTGTLEAPIYPPAEEGAAHEPADKSPDARPTSLQADGEDEVRQRGF